MARKNLIFCDICEERFSDDSIEFYFNGNRIDICGSQCFVLFWANEYNNAQENKYCIKASTGIEVIKKAAK